MAGKKMTKDEIAALLAELEADGFHTDEPPRKESSSNTPAATGAQAVPHSPEEDPGTGPELLGRRPSAVPAGELESLEGRKRNESKASEGSKISKMKEFLGRPSIDSSKSDSLGSPKEEKKKDPTAVFFTKKSSKSKLRPEFNREFTDIHSKQKMVLSMEDLTLEQMAGHLQVKQGIKGEWRMQYCLLDASDLFIFKTTPDDKAWKIGISKGFTVEAVELDDPSSCFKFTTPPDHTFFFLTSTPQERDAWVSALQKAMVSTVASQVVRNSIRDEGIKGAIKVYGEALNQPDKIKAILIDTGHTTAEVVKMALQKYQINDNPEKYGLFERTPEGEEYPINDSDFPLVVKTFWDSQSIQRDFCIKEKYPNFGRFERTLQRVDALKNSLLAGGVPHPASGPSVDLADPSLGEVFRDSLFGGGPFAPLSTSSSLLPPSMSALDINTLASPSLEDDELLRSGSKTLRSREVSDSKDQSAAKSVLRLSAFGMEAVELMVN